MEASVDRLRLAVLRPGRWWLLRGQRALPVARRPTGGRDRNQRRVDRQCRDCVDAETAFRQQNRHRVLQPMTTPNQHNRPVTWADASEFVIETTDGAGVKVELNPDGSIGQITQAAPRL